MATLTTLTFVESSAVTPTSQVHVVITGDTSQSPDGSSYKANLIDLLHVTGFTYNNANTFTISRNLGLPNLTATINTVTGLTVNGALSATTLSATTLTVNGSPITGGGGLSWTIAPTVGGQFQLYPAANTAYIINGTSNPDAALAHIYLPTGASVGDFIEIIVDSSANCDSIEFLPQTGRFISVGSEITTAGGRIDWIGVSDSKVTVRFICTVANSKWVLVSFMNNVSYALVYPNIY